MPDDIPSREKVVTAMSPELNFELRLEERRADRVYVAVLLAPASERPVTLEGVAVQLFQRSGDPMSSRLLLPISGTLTQPMVTTVELRAHGGALPAGSRVVGTAWNPQLQAEATCPADQWTELESHVRGTRVLWPKSKGQLRVLAARERSRLAGSFPWLGRAVVIPFDGVLEHAGPFDGVLEHAEPAVAEPEEQQEDLDALCAEYGLCGEEAAFLKELLSED